MFRALSFFLAAIGILSVLGMTVLFSAEPKPPDTKFENLQPLINGMKPDMMVKLYEGLPHPDEEEVLTKELKEKSTVKLRGFDFYLQPLTLKDEDRKKLIALFLRVGTFKQYGGGKFCGGFHPDYLLEWRDCRGVSRAQLCIGCAEMRCFGPKYELLCDMSEEAHKQFARILLPYRTNRPKPEIDLVEHAAALDEKQVTRALQPPD